jgi:hypothetical protein
LHGAPIKPINLVAAALEQPREPQAGLTGDPNYENLHQPGLRDVVAPDWLIYSTNRGMGPSCGVVCGKSKKVSSR